MKQILHFILKFFAKRVVKKYHPLVIGITGSVGKTSTKEAVFSVLQGQFKVRRGVKNYNNEIGTPLTIFGYQETPGRNIFKWASVFFSALNLLWSKGKKYPQVLILEMGADKPGDIKYLTSMARPSIAMITAIGPSHLEFFGQLKNIVKEKAMILDSLKNEEWAILNNDDPNLETVIKNVKSKLITFGQSDTSQVRISDIILTERDGQYGTSFKLKYQGSEVPMFLPKVLGWQHAQAAAAGATVGLAMGLNLVKIGEQLRNYKPARGRTNLIKGVKNTFIIDDTYNASPQSSKVALSILADMPVAGRKIAVFGDMLELGSASESGHRSVGEEVFKLGVGYLFVIGERSRDIARGARDAGMLEDHIFHFPYTMEAGVFLQERLQTNDVILIKGSRASKMEQMVYEIMAKPWEADELLVGSVVR
jgi:UDP-N-acetylmuramoyl-tripeptide--D-alanyl-D-alanine ligase